MKIIVTLLSLIVLSSSVHAQTLQQLYPVEYATILDGARANDCDSDVLLCILLAVRTCEAGRSGFEFGVTHPRAKDQPNSLRVQAGWAARTLSNQYQRWLNAEGDIDLIDSCGARYAPVGVANDPEGLNANWTRNVRSVTERNLRVLWGLERDTQFIWMKAREM